MLLSAGVDVQLLAAIADGHQTLTLEYLIAGGAVGALQVGLYASDDAAFDALDTAICTINLDAPGDLVAGVHQKDFAIGAGGDVVVPGAGADERTGDYWLLAVADPDNAIPEDDADAFNEDNTAALAGGYLGADGALFVHGTALADSILLTPGRGTVIGILNGVTVTYASSELTSISVWTHDGDDVVNGAKAAEPLRIWGGEGNDSLTGGLAEDRLDGGPGDDHLWGMAGDDALLGGDGDDVMDGGPGADLLYGGDGDDNLIGGAGDDFLDGGAGVNTLAGSGGKDTWVLAGGDGADTIVADSTVMPATATRTTGGLVVQADTFADLQPGGDWVLLSGGDGDDSLVVLGKARGVLLGGAGDDDLQGGPGADQLSGGDGNDTLSGGGGNDWLWGGDGDDTLDGGAGNDTLLGSGGADIVRPGAGKNGLLFGGIGEQPSLAPVAQAAAEAVMAGAVVAAAPTISFSTTVAMSGSLFGFGGGLTAHVSVTGTIDQDGIITGALTATGSGAGHANGANALFDFTAGGSVSGPMDRLLVIASWHGDGTVYFEDGGSADGSAGGSWSGTIALASGSGAQKLKADEGGGFKGNVAVAEFTVAGGVQGAAGSSPAGWGKSAAKVISPGFFSSVCAARVLSDPRVDASHMTTGGSVLSQLQAQAQGRPIVGSTGNATWVQPQVYDMISRLADTYGAVEVNELAGGQHGTRFDEGGLSRHYKGYAVDFGSIGTEADGWQFGTDWQTYADAVTWMYYDGILPTGNKDVMEVGLGIGAGQSADLQKAVADFISSAGGDVKAGAIQTVRNTRTAAVAGYSITVSGTDDLGQKVNIKFKTDSPNHLHIGLPRF